MPVSGGMRDRGDEHRPATADDVAEHIRLTCAVPSAGPTVGAEVEWLVVDLADPSARPTVAKLEKALGEVVLPGGSRVSFEPGGQVELSSPPGRSADEAASAVTVDFSVLRPALRARGLDLVSVAHDPTRPPLRVSDSPRYEAMEQWFAEEGWAGAPEMMCNTASVQVNVGCGPDPSATWQRANALAPVLAAMFAWSARDGWASSRLRAWTGIDPSRTASAAVTGDAVLDWTGYALSARVVMRQADNGQFVALSGGVTLRQWIERPPPGWAAPTMADVEVHLSTLFPPIRLKGWIEVRVIDMPGDGSWAVPLAVTAALLAPGVPQSAFGWLDSIQHMGWEEAARMGLDSAPLATAADRSLQLALTLLDEQGSTLLAEVQRFRAERVAPRVVRAAQAEVHPVG